jgi:signal transduction histidine kinase
MNLTANSPIASDRQADQEVTQRERELGAIISAYNTVTEQLKQSHERLGAEVARLREELSRKNEELRRRERLASLGELAAGVAHEVRNPLGGIQMIASLLRKDIQDRPVALKQIGKIQHCVTTLESIVTDILEFGRPAEPQVKRIQLQRVVSDTVELVATKAVEHSVDLRLSPELGRFELASDSVLLQRVLMNLMVNAIEAAGPNSENDEREETPRVEIEVADDGEHAIVLSIHDNGPGIPSEAIERVFDPFFTTKDDGTGLGLAIVHQMVESLGGSIHAGNDPTGGAVFRVRLPKELKTEASAEPAMTGTHGNESVQENGNCIARR